MVNGILIYFGDPGINFPKRITSVKTNHLSLCYNKI